MEGSTPREQRNPSDRSDRPKTLWKLSHWWWRYFPLLGIQVFDTFGLLLIGLQADKGRVPLALLWSMAWFGMGSLLGFLFGIPRVVQGTLPAPHAPRDPTAEDPPPTAAASGAPLFYDQRVNTNLEQISDWLTKILLGVGLIQIKELPSTVKAIAWYMATGLTASTDAGAPPAQAQGLATAIVLYCGTMGFLGSYVWSRMYIARTFRWADQAERPRVAPRG
ncbi:hypothetical protein [Vitiosangium sp. GDMCC 1.1324]|uniref:hypothetical protein n=1 Tax=Vitiosangium sp. (strain GDMCC 1.1324) TaxID=2138576 RepID=UPI000D378571|nr:hypothetical protein [Vitiosangium sp. GDMCC 1.1324]PTL78380.1 hypothetical protein DAT35_38220 [Vitiosangium sp. GDMCC 1.1324]